MGWLDKLLGRDTKDAGEPAAASAGMDDRSAEPAAVVEEDDPHAGHDHPPGQHPNDDNV